MRGLLAAGCFYVVAMSVLKSFNHDELEAVHSAWKISKGQVIYADFFQLHDPLLYACLSPLVAVCGERPATLVICRLAMLPFLAAIAASAWLLGRRLFGETAAVIGTGLLLTSWPFLAAAVEIRPDVPEVAFGMLALVLLFPPEETRTRRFTGRLLLLGVCLGVSFLFLQKAIFIMAGAAIVLLWRVCRGEYHWTALLAVLLGTAAALTPFAIWLAAHRLFSDYFFLNWTLHAYYRKHFSVADHLAFICGAQFVMTVFALLAPVCMSGRRQWQLAAVAAVLFSQLLLVRLPNLQYWMPLLPLAALFAGHAMTQLLGRRPTVLAALLAASAATPAVVLAILGQPTNWGHLKEIDYVLRIAAPSDTVYDGNAAFNVFREDIDYFWFCVSPDEGLGTYQMLREYQYDVYDLIERKKPKVVSTYEIANLNDARIRGHYVKSPIYPWLLLRRD